MDELAGAGVTLVPTKAGVKTCSKCRESKPLDQFGTDRKRQDGRNPQCRVCRAAYYRKNDAAIIERTRAWYLENRKTAALAHQRYVEANRSKIADYQRRYRDENRVEIYANVRRRRARKACAVPQRWQIHDVLPFCCYWCGSNLRAYGATSHVDHVMPISLGGPAVPSNEVMTCASCNLRKSAKHPLVWLAELTA